MQVIQATTDFDAHKMGSTSVTLLNGQYHNEGTVPILDDITDLEEATAAFLADRSDGECFCLDNPGYSLLLPGELFVANVSKMETQVCCGQDQAEDFLDAIDKCLRIQMALEDMPQETFNAATSELADTSQATCSYLAHDSDTGISSPTPRSNFSSTVYWMFEELSLRPKLRICDTSEEHDSDQNGSYPPTDAKIDTPDAISESIHAQASRAASFFDPLTDSIISYTSLESLFEMDERYGDLPVGAQQLSGEASILVEDYIVSISHEDYFDRTVGHETHMQAFNSPLQVATHLSMILDDASPSVSFFPSMDREIHRRLPQPGCMQSTSFLKDDREEEEAEEEAPCRQTSMFVTVAGITGETIVKDTIPPSTERHPDLQVDETTGLYELFADDIWDSEPKLELVLPSSGIAHAVTLARADPDIIAVVLQIVRTHS